MALPMFGRCRALTTVDVAEFVVKVNGSDIDGNIICCQQKFEMDRGRGNCHVP